MLFVDKVDTPIGMDIGSEEELRNWSLGWYSRDDVVIVDISPVSGSIASGQDVVVGGGFLGLGLAEVVVPVHKGLVADSR